MENKTYAQKMIDQYSVKEESKIDQLKALDKNVKKSPAIFAYVFGSIASLVLGTGMSLAMKVIGGTALWMWIGIAIGVFGIALMGLNYAIYKFRIKRRKAKYSEKILSLSQEILSE